MMYYVSAKKRREKEIISKLRYKKHQRIKTIIMSKEVERTFMPGDKSQVKDVSR